MGIADISIDQTVAPEVHFLISFTLQSLSSNSMFD